MGRLSTALLAGVALIVTGGAVMAHHSFAMFDQDHPMELQGTVTEFKFTSPHTFILLEVKGADGSATHFAVVRRLMAAFIPLRVSPSRVSVSALR